MEREVKNGVVKSQNCIAPDVYHMVIEEKTVAKSAKVGQFINIYPKQKHILLPRPISISEIDESSITIVYSVVGQGTAEFATYNAGDEIKISTALGSGFVPQDVKTHILVGGGIGVPPLVELAKQVSGEKIAVLGFRDEPFLKERLEELGVKVFVATDSGNFGFKGNVVELIKSENIVGDYYYSCGPKPMLKALSEHCEQINKPLQVSLEERMGCGYGACVGCVCKIKTEETISRKKVCKDGPVFLSSEVVW
ncbi:MAG: oxidoreductase [Epulopiscium sp. Nele67-Bin005]|nr:MAG: oxidoreductase [Epulopiscium sp. Nele67-Bin005]